VIKPWSKPPTNIAGPRTWPPPRDLQRDSRSGFGGPAPSWQPRYRRYSESTSAIPRRQRRAFRHERDRATRPVAAGRSHTLVPGAQQGSGVATWTWDESRVAGVARCEEQGRLPDALCLPDALVDRDGCSMSDAARDVSSATGGAVRSDCRHRSRSGDAGLRLPGGSRAGHRERHRDGAVPEILVTASPLGRFSRRLPTTSCGSGVCHPQLARSSGRRERVRRRA
jgi:hypothetical protein